MQTKTLGAYILGLAAVLGACDANSSGSDFGGKSNGGTGGSSGGASGSGGQSANNSGATAGSSGNAGTAGFNVGGNGTGATGGSNSCGGEVVKAEKIPLDIYIMMDQSGSMTGEVDTGVTKWDAVVSAMTDFLNNTPTDGLGVGVQFFSVIVNNAPETCTNTAQCNGAGTCVDAVKACLYTSITAGSLVACNSDADCPGDTCEVVGLCTGGQYACFPNDPIYSACQTGSCGPYRVCDGRDSCNPADYANPTVGIGPLDQTRSQIISQFNREPNTNTPTGPALQGAVDYAKTWATGQGAGHAVIDILVTDGLPSVCTPIDIPEIAQIAQTAKQGSPSIKTYVIGVFTPDEAFEAQSNLDQIANAGADRPAFIISSNVTQQLIAALDEIRGNALSCEYVIPADTSTNADFNHVNVQFTPSGGAPETVYYVGDQSHCDPTTGGWYYDVNPTTGGTPTKILTCPTTCTTFQGANEGSVNIQIGCETQSQIE